MSNSHHRRNSSVKVRKVKDPRKSPSSPATVESQVAREMVTLLGGGGSGGGSLGGVGGGMGCGLGGVFGSSRRGAGSPPGSSASTAQTAQALAALTRALATLLSAETANTSAITANTAAMHAGSMEDGVMGLLGGSGGTGSGVMGPLGGSGDGGGIGGFFGSLLGGFGSLLGLGSLASSLFSLFSGPGPQQVLNPYIPPIPQTQEVADAPSFPMAGTSADGSAITGPTSNVAPSAQPMQITVNVNAMDSQSFQDNAPALASAVRTAMLSMHPINQLIRENF
jgi:hypothetical protein